MQAILATNARSIKLQFNNFRFVIVMTVNLGCSYSDMSDPIARQTFMQISMLGRWMWRAISDRALLGTVERI
jgi:hypothetical protein